MSAFLSVDNVSRRFGPQLTLGDRIAARLGANVETRTVHAVDRVALEVKQGETLGLVGESGCGKSTLGRVMAGILPPSDGAVLLDGVPVMEGGLKTTTRVQTVFQDPFASLDPRMKVGDAVAEGPIAHGLTTKAESKAYVAQWFERVGLDPDWASRYPHQFSGGQRQRLAIARALAMQPDMLICDEPVASLDVSIQAQIINLFLELRRDLGLTCVFISHDLSVVQHVSDRVVVMYLGRIVELGETQAVFDAPAHPYTRALLASVPKLVIDSDTLVDFQPIEGEVPSPLSPPPGCHYNPRCPLAADLCRAEVPQFRALGNARFAACHFAEEV
ncbi:oligopeptide/dipeptide ABC transporter ATP-binding protein [Sulfitobacter sp. HNIBRBA3233]|uniref:ABC transporter ATP-binding protein n=1 Tax=Sulfitobacter marinivivus TaxID=3158558 RepID=UPI0032E02CB6